MQGWETVLAAVGGLVLGLGLGVLLGRRGGQGDGQSQRLREVASRLRTVVVPVLERQATTLGVPIAERGPVDGDGIEVTLALGTAIQRREEREDLPFSDTLEISRGELGRQGGQKRSS